MLWIFEIGDRLRGVGELPFVDGGFEGAIKVVCLFAQLHGILSNLLYHMLNFLWTRSRAL